MENVIFNPMCVKLLGLVKSHKGQFCSVTTETIPAMNLGGRSHDNTLYGHVTKVTLYKGLQIGCDYYAYLIKGAEKCNVSRETIEQNKEERNGMIHADGDNVLLYSAKYNQFYLNLTQSGCVKFSAMSTYFVDGHEATNDELIIINKYLTVKPNSVSKWEKLGIDKKYNPKTIAPKVENIVSIVVGSDMYKRETATSIAIAK